MVATYREHGHALVRGVPMNAVMAEMYGKAEGCSGGRGGSMHLFDARPPISMAATPLSAAACRWPAAWRSADKLQAPRHRLFLRRRRRGRGRVPRDMNLAELWDVPVLFVCENNGYAMGSALARTEAETDIHAKAAAYGIDSEVVDGMDVVAVEAAARRRSPAFARPAAPYFLECRTYRFRAHSMFDAQLYRDKEEIAKWREKGPIVRFQGWLLENGCCRSMTSPASRPKRMPRSPKPWPLPRPEPGSRWRR
jgi:2-oxoisovalerate dehydrogenase E1 component